jgi:two-component system cell cycle sensor histidine kinase PleC
MRFRQILTNLVSNAVKYSAPAGRIQVVLETAASGGVKLTVRDDGPGMTAEELQKALSRFGRLGHPETQTKSGVGLGLPIAQDLARLLNGTLTVHTEKGRGTRIVVRLGDMPSGGIASGIGRTGECAP